MSIRTNPPNRPYTEAKCVEHTEIIQTAFAITPNAVPPLCKKRLNLPQSVSKVRTHFALGFSSAAIDNFLQSETSTTCST